MKDEILWELSHAKDYISGQELCEKFGVSRTAIWKVIHSLMEDGYEIESVQRKGYRILSRPDRITAEEVGSRMETSWAGKNPVYFERTGSTNTEAARLADQGAPEGTLVIAEQQDGGKGRRGRSWMTPAGSSIAMSLVVRPQIRPDRISMVTLIMGLSVAYACKDCYDLPVKIKWPNDVVVDGKKICGILTEMIAEVDYIKYLVIGTGINMNIEEFPEELKNKAASIHSLIGHRPDRAALIAACMKRFEEFYEKFIGTQDLSLLQTEYNQLLAGIGSAVRVLEPGNEYEGISRGINSMGELLVERKNGILEEVYAGEVSVRGIYGYV